MPTKPPSAPPWLTMGELLKRLGGVSPDRVRLRPLPGTATEEDLLAIHAREDKLYELVDGVLVEKIMGTVESYLTCDLIYLLKAFLAGRDLGFLLGPDGAVRLMPGLIRIPDISFISWKQLPKRERPTDAIADLAPYLAIEVLSEGNTPEEMSRKVREYFLGGSRLAGWSIPGSGSFRSTPPRTSPASSSKGRPWRLPTCFRGCPCRCSRSSRKCRPCPPPRRAGGARSPRAVTDPRAPARRPGSGSSRRAAPRSRSPARGGADAPCAATPAAA